MRTYYVTLIGTAPGVRAELSQMMAHPDERIELAEHFYKKIQSVVEKDLGRAGVDYESAGPSKLISGKEFLEKLNPDESLPFSSRISVEYLFEEWLDKGNVLRSLDSFEAELSKLQDVLLLYYYIDG